MHEFFFFLKTQHEILIINFNIGYIILAGNLSKIDFVKHWR